MDTTARDLDDEAIRGNVERGTVKRGTASVRDLRPEPFPDGNERLSDEVDAVVYGVRRVAQ